MAKVGVWLVGAQGSLASTVVLGARAIARRLATGGGLVTELPELAALPFVPLADLAFGGWDIAPTGLVARARELAADDGAVAESLVTGLEADLKSIEAAIPPGFALGGCPAGTSPPPGGGAGAAFRERGQNPQAPFAGSGGKGGETRVKPVPAPMFPYGTLGVLSGGGYNTRGGGEGGVLGDPRHKRSK